jgi:asparagine synthase (glutamine-hydrolysing)
MCGITGIMAFNLVGKMNMIHLTNATMALKKRGPDFQDIYYDEFVGLGHRRLSIIDTSAASNQPLWDESKRYCIVFNGEIFNFKSLKESLLKSGYSFSSQGDSEVLLKLFMRDGEACLNQLNGFFAFCIYDREQQSLFVARDRYGVKPLLYCYDEDRFIFGSEMKAITTFGIDKNLDFEAIYAYLQLNYIPAPQTIFKHVHKLLPGHCIVARKGSFELKQYYYIPFSTVQRSKNYEEAKTTFKKLLETSVERRLVSDVPLGAFLSGGIDSSVITGIASKLKSDLHTFSIGFRDEKFFDETDYARLVAKKFNTEHTVFSLSNDDLYAHVHDILDYIDEPFADSSAINVYILSKETRKHATVALSGDGADELLGGYNKHAAFLRSINPGVKEKLVSGLLPVLKMLPQSRNGRISNKVRQAVRFGEGNKLPLPERYWRWAIFADGNEAMKLFSDQARQQLSVDQFESVRKDWLKPLTHQAGMNEILLTDTNLVLPNDMLMKVDLMSMANSLEVRTPFLDFELVNFIFSLPHDFKISRTIRKRILQDSFRDLLPPELYNRPKKGFEVPMLKWLRREMKSLIEDDLLSEKTILEQGIFNYSEIKGLKDQLFSSNPGDVHARIWGLVVFQWWWRKSFSQRSVSPKSN